MWFGLNTEAKVAILVSMAIFPVIINTYSGIKDTRGAMLEVGRAFGASESQIFFKIILPGMVPHVMAGIRSCIGLSIIGMVVAEFLTAQVGMGRLISDAANRFQMATVYFGIVVLGALGIGLADVLMRLERKFSHWRALERARE
jgi:NitT/TauT family transport system permease protein